MGGTYTRERTKARSRAKRRGSRGRRGRTGNKKVRTGKPDRATVKASAGTVESAARAHSEPSPAGASRVASLRRTRRLGQRSSQRIGAGAQETGGPGPLVLEARQRDGARSRGLWDHDEVDPARQKGRCRSKELAKKPLGAVSRHRIAEFACHRNPEPGGPVIRPRGHENDRARQHHARARLLNAEKLAALADATFLRKCLSRPVLQGAFARRPPGWAEHGSPRRGRRSYFL
jgi:hypothetical protein